MKTPAKMHAWPNRDAGDNWFDPAWFLIIVQILQTRTSSLVAEERSGHIMSYWVDLAWLRLELAGVWWV
jgi:hypothetical protein